MLLLTLALAISNIIAYNRLSHTISSDADRFSMSNATEASTQVENWFHTIRDGLIEAAPSFTSLYDDQLIVAMLRQHASASQATNILVGYEDGRSYGAIGGKRDLANYDPRQRDWYRLAKNAGRTVVTEVYNDAITNAMMISISTPFYDDGRLNGVMLADIELHELDEIIERASFAGATIMVMDHSSLMLAVNTNKYTAGKSKLAEVSGLRPLTEKVMTEGKGAHHYELFGVNKVAYFQNIKLDDNNQWHFFIGLDTSVAYAELKQATTQTLLWSAVMLIASMLAMLASLSVLYRPILELKDTVNDLASGQGDLTQRLAIRNQDDLGQIAGSINRFIETLQQLMLDVSHSSSDSEQGTQRLVAQNQQSYQLLQKHTGETEQVVTAISQMSEAAHSIARDAVQTAELTQSAAQEANQSKEVVKDAVASSSELINQVETMEQRIQAMTSDTKRIESVLDVIGSIAEQTNLLALNAAIEAARAGEQGRGFAVVADEVRALAARTQESTSEINTMLNSLSHASQEVVAAMDETKQVCEHSAHNTASVSQSLDTMTNSIVAIDELSAQISAAAEEQSTVTKEINLNMSQIQELVGELGDTGRQLLGETEQLQSSNQQLGSVVSRFKLQ
ncbi:methyl-accepting chemotaxis protein [Ferrimonas aestuarii]|uniref:Methyl-accepting chemotaxis protein n=2 Tax=Ferrimonas aestuarii TaxID=2569539 RepID=A0A4U1BP33_9GAMM|nr:methyl-accepting chemotaxis protein [Ferrimonas aestuarii]